ncbi:MAG: single-stranded-DNA-specific exonuclease RecJ [Candidatus Levybacteria bacterium]|nr:single-stranded-DNA-specific exonuclease RecJ [Candidatus Levybacteria bacterium]
MKKWKIVNKFPGLDKRSGAGKIKNKKLKIEEILNVLLENRGIKTEKEKEKFLNPKLSDVTISSVGIDKKQLKKAIARINRAIISKEEIVIYGDYDVDGICGTAILWETLNDLGAKVLPYIPHRMDEGYGLSKTGIKNLIRQLDGKNCSLIITVDNGIVANDAVDLANREGIDVIITDHHVSAQKLPKAYSFVHTTQVCGAGVAFLLAQEINAEVARKNFRVRSAVKSPSTRNAGGAKAHNENFVDSSLGHLELVALATIADLVPLKGANRTFVKFGLEELRKTKRPGLLAIIEETGIDQVLIGVYEIGHIIAPRLNAMGRLEYAMDSLRLLCTKSKERAKDLAYKLGHTNRKRQEITLKSFEHARLQITNSKSQIPKLLLIADKSYQQGVIGLIAGKLVEEFYRPSIVISKGEIYSKASARSISGFNIVEFIRSASDLLVDVGGHPMAAGFTVETINLELLQKKLEKLADKILTQDLFVRSLYIDCEFDINYLNEEFYNVLQKLAPFGMGNSQPAFVSKNIIIEDMRLVGMDGRHLKLNLKTQISNLKIEGIGFGMGERSNEIRIGDRIDLVYQIEKNEWNGNSKLQLKIKDLRRSIP